MEVLHARGEVSTSPGSQCCQTPKMSQLGMSFAKEFDFEANGDASKPF